MRAKILVYGEVYWEKRDGAEALGGSPFLLAQASAALGDEAALYSRVGNDPKGQLAAELISRQGIDASFVQFDGRRPTPQASFRASSSGGALAPYLPADASHAGIGSDAQALDALSTRDFDVLCFQTLVQKWQISCDTLCRLVDAIEAREIFYCVNLLGDYFSKAIIEASLQRSTVACLCHDDAATVSTLLFGRILPLQEFCETVSRTHALPLICVHGGPAGCAVYHAGSFVTVTSGAARSANRFAQAAFVASFAHCLCSHLPPLEAAKRACEVAAHAASGSAPGRRYPSEILKLVG